VSLELPVKFRKRRGGINVILHFHDSSEIVELKGSRPLLQCQFCCIHHYHHLWFQYLSARGAGRGRAAPKQFFYFITDNNEFVIGVFYRSVSAINVNALERLMLSCWSCTGVSSLLHGDTDSRYLSTRLSKIIFTTEKKKKTICSSSLDSY